MIDDKGVILAKQKQVTMRPLDKKKLEQERTFWQSYSLLVPPAVITLFGVAWFFIRKRRFAR